MFFSDCSDDTQSNCIVVEGKLTVYFPDDMTPEAISEESDQLLGVVESEMKKNDWDGMQVSYDNAPFPSEENDSSSNKDATFPTVASAEENSSSNEQDGGLSNGVIAGIIVLVVVLIAVVGVLLIRFIRTKREDEKEPLKRKQEIPLEGKNLSPF